MKRNYIRLQGAEWHNKKDNLILFSYKKNKYGRIKGFYKEKDRDGYWYTHWMNDREIEEFKKEHDIKVTTQTFHIGDWKIVRDDYHCNMMWSPRENTKKKEEPKTRKMMYSVQLVKEYYRLRDNWEDLKKWLEKKKKDDKYHYNSLERLATYDLVLDKMIGLEGRNKND